MKGNDCIISDVDIVVCKWWEFIPLQLVSNLLQSSHCTVTACIFISQSYHTIMIKIYFCHLRFMDSSILNFIKGNMTYYWIEPLFRLWSWNKRKKEKEGFRNLIVVFSRCSENCSKTILKNYKNPKSQSFSFNIRKPIHGYFVNVEDEESWYFWLYCTKLSSANKEKWTVGR